MPAASRYSLVCSATALLVGGMIATAAVVKARGEAADPSGSSQHRRAYRRPAAAPFPSDNGYTEARERLGRTLFFDPILSESRRISCATCHNPGLSWGDGLARAFGASLLKLERRTPTILNLAWAPALFWDGRADTLEDQAMGPIQAAGEMNMPAPEMVRRLAAIDGYRVMFEDAYAGEAIAPATVAKAIATFERGVVSAQAPFDRWVAGDARAIPASAQRGFVLFNEKARCSLCHGGWRLTDDGFHDIGVASDDIGRGRFTPAIELTRFAFKTPTLRNVVERAPYMHDGSAATLEAVVDLYDRGGVARRPSLSREIKPLGLTDAEKNDLVAFMRTLTSLDPEARVPLLPR